MTEPTPIARVTFFFALLVSFSAFYYLVEPSKKPKNNSSKKSTKKESNEPITVRKSIEPEGCKEKGIPHVVQPESGKENFFYQEEQPSNREGIYLVDNEPKENREALLRQAVINLEIELENQKIRTRKEGEIRAEAEENLRICQDQVSFYRERVLLLEKQLKNIAQREPDESVSLGDGKPFEENGLEDAQVAAPLEKKLGLESRMAVLPVVQ